MTTIKEYDKRAQDRIFALSDLVTLMETLPVAHGISFGDDDYLRLDLSSTDEFDAWAKHLGAIVTYRDHRHGDTVQCHGYASWSGWSVYIGTCVRDPQPDVTATAQAIPTPDAPELPTPELDREVAGIFGENHQVKPTGHGLFDIPEPPQPRESSIKIVRHQYGLGVLRIKAPNWDTYTVISIGKESVPAWVWDLPDGAELNATVTPGEYGDPEFASWWTTDKAHGAEPSVPAAISAEPVSNSRIVKICYALDQAGRDSDAEAAAAREIPEIVSFDRDKLMATLRDGQTLIWTFTTVGWAVGSR